MRLGWRMSFRIWISLLTLSISLISAIFFFSSILMATFCSVSSCIANLTFPKVPWPRVFSFVRKKNYRRRSARCAFWVTSWGFMTWRFRRPTWERLQLIGVKVSVIKILNGRWVKLSRNLLMRNKVIGWWRYINKTPLLLTTLLDLMFN